MSRQAFWRIIAAMCCALALSPDNAAQSDGADALSPVEREAVARDHLAAAREAAQSGDLELAERRLRSAVRAGFVDFSAMQRDPALASLRDRPVMAAILAARNAADDLLAQRRIDDWAERLGRSRYAQTRDEERKIDLLIGPASGQCAAAALASIRRTLGGFIEEFFPSGLPHRVLVIILDEEDEAIFLPRPNAHGQYLHPQRLILAADSGRALQHELVHALHHAHMDALGQEHPMWVQEGLASLFESMVHSTGAESAEDDGNPFVFERNERDTIMEMMIQRGSAMLWSEFFAQSADAFERDGGSNYAQARSIMRFLHNSGHLAAWYESFCADFAKDPTGGLALESVLEESLERVETNWRGWIKQGAPTAAPKVVLAATDQIPVESAAIDDPPLAQPPSRAIDGVYERIRPRMLHEYRAAIPHLGEVIAIDPTHAAARYDLGLALVLAGDLTGAESEQAALDRLDRNLASLLASAINAHSRAVRTNIP